MSNKYPEVWKVAQYIEGLCNGVGSHAGGVIFYDEPITNTTALMKTSNGDIVTQYDLHRLESVSLIKIDLLSIEALDRIRACLDLLTKYSYIDENLSLRERYETTIGVYKIDRTTPEMWKMIHEHKIESLFQMEQQSGIKGIAATKPTSLEELATLNSVIRLMAQEKGAEQPIDKFARFKKDINNWYKEMEEYGLTIKEQKLLETILLDSSGICESQEKFMSLVQLPECGGFSLLWSDKLRKSVAKKDPAGFEKLQEEFFEITKEKKCHKEFCEYVWNVLVCTSKGYGFNLSHTLAYSIVALQEMNLAYKYPIIFWNTANLIVDSGSMNLEEEINLNEDNEDDEDDNENEEKIKNSSTDYGRIAAAIGKMKSRGINFSLPDINKSDITFSPLIKENKIVYGLRGITRIGNQLIKNIIVNRPYNNIEDFLTKIKVNKLQMISLIKSGCFDNLYSELSRHQVMAVYLDLIADKKKRITLQNMQMLIAKDLIPEELDFEKKVFNFNKYLKKNKQGIYYHLDSIAFRFYANNYNEELLESVVINNEEQSALIKQATWDYIYKKEMNPVRDWMKANQEEILNKLNDILYQEVAEKYTEGSISKWEMDSLSFYYHEHELNILRNDIYEVSNYFDLPEEPEIENEFQTKDNKTISIFKLSRIAGTVIDKNKDKGIVTLLTPNGVVTVKVWKTQFPVWDKQISEKDVDGTKHVIEKSWFSRGNKLIITGIKRDNTFVPKKYKNTEFPLFEKINEIDDKGFINQSQTKRIEVD